MFSKGKNQSQTRAPAPRTEGFANTATVQPSTGTRRDKPAKAAAPSIFSSDLVVEGTLHSDGDIQIDGRIEGNITSGSLTIGEKAVINGEIKARDVTIRGRVIGSIRGYKVQLSSTSHVEGDILHNALAVESGAFFDGNCRHAEDPLTAEMPKSGRPVAGPPMGDSPSGPGSSPIKSKPAPKAANGVSTDNGRTAALRSTPVS